MVEHMSQGAVPETAPGTGMTSWTPELLDRRVVRPCARKPTRRRRNRTLFCLATHKDGHHQRLLDRQVEVQFYFVLENDPSLIPILVALLHKEATRFRLYDGCMAERVDVALIEALTNGIDHGNLELDSSLRQDGEAVYRKLSEERRQVPPYRDRRLHVRARLSRTEAVYIIRDEGPGFDPDALPDPTATANLEKASGRGLLLIRTFMDEVTFNQAGNQITLVKRRTITPPECE